MKRAPFVVIGFSVAFLAVCCSMQGQISFFQPPTYSGNGPLFVADFNGDGKPDILTGDGTMNLGNGDGTFTPGTTVSGGVLAVADFNGDGKPDVLQQGTGTLLVLLGKGDGTFQAPISSPSNANLSLVAATDLNADGKADAIGIFNNALIVYLGKGDGTFAAGVSYNLGSGSSSPIALSLGDFNGDGKTDVVITTLIGNTFAGQESTFLGNGDGTFQSARTSATIQDPGYVAVGDFNGDGKLDLAVSSVSNIPFNCGPGGCVVSVLLGNGDGTFQTPTSVIAASGSLASADVNGDGKLDLVFQGDPTLAQIYMGNGDGTFSNASNYVLTVPSSIYGYPTSGGPIAIADFNGDGKLDVAIGGYSLLGNGNGTLRAIPLSATPSAVGLGVTGVFDKSSSLPGVAVEAGTSLYILKNNGDGTLSMSHTYTLQIQGYQIFAADLNGDGTVDLLVLNYDSTTLQAGYSFLAGDGDGSFQAPAFYPLNINGHAVLADLNHDKKLDLAIEENNQSVGILLGNGDGTFSSPVSYFTDGAGIPVVADFNGDGNLDIASYVGTNPVQTSILYGNGDGTFKPAVFPPSLSGFGVAYTADLNNDGKADLISSGQVALGNGDGAFALLPPLSNGNPLQGIVGVAAVVDLNGDGKLDLIVDLAFGSHFVETVVLLGNGDGTFGPQINVPPGYVPSPFLVADMNNDGRPDLVFFWSTSAVSGIGVELNTTPPGFELSASPLSPASVTAGNSATSTLTVSPTFGFNSSVTLSCSGLPSGATCSFNPPTIVSSSGSSVLTVSTTASTVPGTYPVKVQGIASSIANSVAVPLVVQAPPDFGLSPSPGSPTSQTISAGQTASFSLGATPTGGFTGAVSLICAITPVVSPAPACSLSSSTVNLTGSGTQTVTVSVKTRDSSSASLSLPDFRLPWTMTPWIFTIGLSGLMTLNRRRGTLAARACVAPILILVLGALVSCGGSSTSTTTTHGTPLGTYTATVTATSASLNHNTALQVVVQ